ncbi:glycerophosphodiester phosphodiesterase [Acholeplasma hippikon]|uniref:Glycerophosphoryl diester phosphodiesterase n=1 Tax=Acholeplasma hippikon TaxID=264636 RepID=A0A449BJZ5_9MOLU|nr:glycerophosphodiester phosphodiesterase family protein [Acholeplasma hippikon]VEU82795.1 Glycerophosphoryl diester phosphodiesterase [Acholeplasma hippikon]
MQNDLFKLDVKWVAHRGLSSKSIENTIDSFENAAKLPFFGMECDIHLTKDGKIIVHHDSNVKRLTGVDKLIKETEFKELLEIPFSFPTLEEYLDICKKGEKQAVIELKGQFTEDNVKYIYEECKKLQDLDKITFISFNRDYLKWMRKIDKTIKLELLLGEFTLADYEYLTENRINLDMYHKNVTRELVEMLKEKDLTVNVFTVNTWEDAKRMIACGVDYITTDGILDFTTY